MITKGSSNMRLSHLKLVDVMTLRRGSGRELMPVGGRHNAGDQNKIGKWDHSTNLSSLARKNLWVSQK